MKRAINILCVCILILFGRFGFANQADLAYVEALRAANRENVSAADVQREIVLLKLQSQITPHWLEPYIKLCDLYNQLGMHSQALKVAKKLVSMKRDDVGLQLRLIDIELQDYQSVDTLRAYLQNKLKIPYLMPEVRSSLYYRLGELSYEQFDRKRAVRYLNLALKSAMQNLKASELLKRILIEDEKCNVSEKYYQQVRDLLARIISNPFDANSAMNLAILAGRMNKYAIMQTWREYSEEIKKQFAPDVNWSEDVLLGLAESYLAANHPKQAIDILKRIKKQYLQAEIFLAIAYKQMGDEQRYQNKVQEIESEIGKKGISEQDLASIAIFFSVYADNKISVALKAIKRIDEKSFVPLADIARALIFVETKQIKAAKDIVSRLGEKGGTFARLVMIKCALAEGNKKLASELLLNELRESPAGIGRDVFVRIAKKMNLSKMPAPDFSKALGLFDKFDSRYLKLIDKLDKMCSVDIKVNGSFEKGEFPELSVVLTNTSSLTLTIGPECVINPAIEIRVSSAADSKLLFLGYMPITERQIFAPKSQIKSSMLLEQTLPLDAKTVSSWDDFIANREKSVTHIVVQARLVSSVLVGEQSVTMNPASSRAVNVFLPRIDRHSATVLMCQIETKNIVARKSNAARKANACGQARIVYWSLKSHRLVNIREKLISCILKRIATCGDVPKQQAYLAWAIRAYKPDKKVFNVLGGLLSSNDWLVRFWSLDTIGCFGGKGSRRLFEHYAVHDSNAYVRQLATSYLLK